MEQDQNSCIVAASIVKIKKSEFKSMLRRRQYVKGINCVFKLTRKTTCMLN